MNRIIFSKLATKQFISALVITLIFIGNSNLVHAWNNELGTKDFILPANTPIPLILDYTLNSKKIKKEKTIEFKVAQDIYIGNNIIPQGTPAVAKVLKSSRGGVWGKGGRLSLAVDYLRLSNGQIISLKAPDIEKEGLSKKGTAWTWFWCTILFVPLNVIPPLCIKGENTEIQAGFTFVANTTQDYNINL